MPVEIVWSPLARARLAEIRAYVALDKPDAAERLATRIVAVVEALRSHPYLGRAGAEPGLRELMIGGTPYSILVPCARQAHHHLHNLAFRSAQINWMSSPSRVPPSASSSQTGSGSEREWRAAREKQIHRAKPLDAAEYLAALGMTDLE